MRPVKNQELLSKEGTALVIIDIQEKLFPHMAEKDRIAQNVAKLVKFAEIMKIPVVLTEQYPKGLGCTIPEVKRLVPNIHPIEKVDFTCLGSEEFKACLGRLEAQKLIITGIESHICVTQTAIDGLNKGYKVYVVSDAVSSRSLADKAIAIERMRQSGVTIVSTEMLIYELLGRAGTAEFREALKLVK